MAYSTISKPSLHFNTKLYTGTGSSNSVTGVGFQPDMTWFKHRSGTSEHNIYDAVRGATKRIIPNDNSAEGTQSNGLSAFGSDGFTVVDSNATNLNNETYASWNWKAGGSASSNSNGSITSSVSANTTSGFSIVSWTGSGSASTIGHGLGSKLSMYIVKNRTDNGEDWIVYHGANTSAPETDYIMLNQTNATVYSSGVGNDTAPTSSVFSVGTAGSTNGSSKNMIAYCVAEKKGYSKFGSYVGNGSSDGSMIWTGMKPAFIITKNTAAASQWTMWDNKRSAFNLTDKILYANGSNAEATATAESVDFLSNGFKIRGSNSGINTHNQKYIFMAFAEEPLVANVGASIPATAR